jgi:predicted phosphodiesterase
MKATEPGRGSADPPARDTWPQIVAKLAVQLPTTVKPMRIALISDIHANVPALQAVLDRINVLEGISATYHLGDLVGYAPWPNETVSLLKAFRIEGIAGNYDTTVACDYKHCGCKYEDSRQEELSHLSYEWTRKHCSDETKAFLRRLPFRLDVRPKGGHTPGPTVILVHGTPTLNTLYWTEDRPDSFCVKMAEMAGAKKGDVICFGHTHKPWHREVDGIHFLNTGSVGRPKDGDWRAGFVILDMSGETPQVEFARVEYDLEQAMAGIRKSDLPDEFAEFLATGGTPRPVESTAGAG